MKPPIGREETELERREITLEQAVAAVREDEPPKGVAEAAATRAWERISHEAGLLGGPVAAIRGCADVQALLPAYREGSLPGPRSLLVKDHLHECAACRAAFREPGKPRLAVLPWRAAAPAPRPVPRSLRRYAAAASILLASGLAALFVRQAFFAVPPGSRAAVQSVSGVLQRVASETAPALRPGEEVGEAEALRTARASHAQLRLRDGSLVEMDERAELSVTARGSDTTIHLERGSIIIQAAKRRSGRLLVASRDCTVYVTGTTFSVNRGLKGSRVSVIEGEVRVVRGREEKSLQPGEQWATGADMGAVPLREEIGWSRNLDQHLSLLGELQALRARLDTLRKPGLRYESRLLPLLPEGAFVFASLPNYGQTLAEAHGLFEERLGQSAVLREWWEKADPARHGGPSLVTVIDKVRSFADFLGEEVVFAVVQPGEDRNPLPILLAEVRRPGLREFLEREMGDLADREGRTPDVRILDGDGGGAAPSAAGKSDVVVLLRSDLVAVSGSPRAAASLPGQLGGGLTRTPFGARIAEAYRDGAGLIFAADLERIANHPLNDSPWRRGQRSPRDAAAMHQAGIDGLRHLIVERKELAGTGETRARLSFAGARRGVVSWLAAPAPMGSLDFISPNAQAAAVFLTKSPSLVLDDVLELAKIEDPSAQDKLAELESKLGSRLRIREDLVDALGAEFALAFDGPILPTPAWRLVVEVYDPARLQTSLQVLADKASDEATRAGRAGPRLEAEHVGAQTYYVLRGGELPFEVHYTFAEGYLVAAPTRPMVMQALHTRETGESLGRSSALRSLFPPDGRDHVSGLVYQNFGLLMGALLGAPGAGTLSQEQRGAFEALARNAKPTLVCVYGEEDGIQVAGSGGLLDLDPADLALPLLLERAMPGTGRRAKP